MTSASWQTGARTSRRAAGMEAARLCARDRRRGARAFTLTELMIAVAVLVGVLLAVGKIFSTTSQVTSIGQATADILQEAAAIERQMRDDLANLSYEDIFVIRCVAVPNYVNDPIQRRVLLNPALPPDAILRCDQLLFFRKGVSSVQTFQIGSLSSHKGQGTSTRVYYGHGFQLGDFAESTFEQSGETYAMDPYPVGGPHKLVPWYSSASEGSVRMWGTRFTGSPKFGFYSGASQELFVPQVDARKWLLVRQPVVLVDDDAEPRDSESKFYYLFDVLSASSIFLFDPELQSDELQVYHGRVDAAASQPQDIRRMVLYENAFSDPPVPRAWHTGASDDQYSLITDQLVYYPRAERYAPSMHRVDQALTNNVLGSACSSIAVDWTWEDGVGYGYLEQYGYYTEFDVNPYFEHPWFGMPDPVEYADTGDIIPDRVRGVGAYGDDDYQDDAAYGWAQTIQPIEFKKMGGKDANRIEQLYMPDSSGHPGVVMYEAVFGYNRNAIFDTTTGDLRPDYTPWPSAIRVTLTLHDPNTILETGGREVQFVIKLPKAPGS